MAFVLAQLTACATIVKGHSQQINVTTNPAGAVCTLERDGESVASINPTPGSVTVEKSRKDLSVDCRKEGYFPAAGKVTSLVTFLPDGSSHVISTVCPRCDLSNLVTSSERKMFSPPMD